MYHRCIERLNGSHVVIVKVPELERFEFPWFLVEGGGHSRKGRQNTSKDLGNTQEGL